MPELPDPLEPGELREIQARLEWPDPDDLQTAAPVEPVVDATEPVVEPTMPGFAVDDAEPEAPAARSSRGARLRAGLRARRRVAWVAAAAVIAVPVMVGAGLSFALSGDGGRTRARPPETTERPVRSTGTTPTTLPPAPEPAAQAEAGPGATPEPAPTSGTTPRRTTTAARLPATTSGRASSSASSAAPQPGPSSSPNAPPPPSSPPPSEPPPNPLCEAVPVLC